MKMMLALVALLLSVAPTTPSPSSIWSPRVPCYDLVDDCGGGEGAQRKGFRKQQHGFANDHELLPPDSTPSFIKCQEKAAMDGGGCIFVPAGM